MGLKGEIYACDNGLYSWVIRTPDPDVKFYSHRFYSTFAEAAEALAYMAKIAQS